MAIAAQRNATLQDRDEHKSGDRRIGRELSSEQPGSYRGGGTGVTSGGLDQFCVLGEQPTGVNGGSVVNPLPAGLPEQVWNDDLEISEFCVTNPKITFARKAEARKWRAGSRSPVKLRRRTTSAFLRAVVARAIARCKITFTSCVSGFPKPSWQTVTVSGLHQPHVPGCFLFRISELSRIRLLHTAIGTVKSTTNTASTCASGISTAVDTYTSNYRRNFSLSSRFLRASSH